MDMKNISDEEYLEWANQLFEEVDDCSICPFSAVNENDRIFDVVKPCYSHPDYYCPCHYSEKYIGLTNQEVVDIENEHFNKIHDGELKYQKYLKEKEEKKKKSIEKGKQTRSINYKINHEINRLRSLIRRREEAIASLSSLKDAFSIADAMFSGKYSTDFKSEKHPQVIQWEKDNERDKRVLEELIKEREKRNRERKKNK